MICGSAAPVRAGAEYYPPVGTMIPPSVSTRIRLNQTISSATSRTGRNFTFTVVDPIRIGRRLVSRAGSRGSGYIVLAGHSGSGGHEGNLTLHIDTIPTVNGNILACDEQFEMNGRKRGLLTSALGLVPIAGIAAGFIQGSNRILPRGQLLRIRFTNFARVVAPAAAVDAASYERRPRQRR